MNTAAEDRSQLRLQLAISAVALIIGGIGAVLAWNPVWSGPDPSREPEWWWGPSWALLLIGISVVVGAPISWWLSKRRKRSR